MARLFEPGGEETMVTPLRQRMLEEMKLAGLMVSTQAVYVGEVQRLLAY